jgi:hypothetical protein
VVGCLVPPSLTVLACAHLDKAEELVSEVEIPAEKILTFVKVNL